MTEILDLDSLLAQLILAVGAALLLGNAYAIFQNSRGRAPKGAEGHFRAPRAWFLAAAGLVMTVWGLASLL